MKLFKVDYFSVLNMNFDSEFIYLKEYLYSMDDAVLMEKEKFNEKVSEFVEEMNCP